MDLWSVTIRIQYGTFKVTTVSHICSDEHAAFLGCTDNFDFLMALLCLLYCCFFVMVYSHSLVSGFPLSLVLLLFCYCLSVFLFCTFCLILNIPSCVFFVSLRTCSLLSDCPHVLHLFLVYLPSLHKSLWCSVCGCVSLLFYLVLGLF